MGQGTMIATTFPVPTWLLMGLYPGEVSTTTIREMLPEILEPDLVIELDTITALWDGIGRGGAESSSLSVVKSPPGFGSRMLVEFAKPVKLAGAEPLLNAFDLCHCALQNVTCLPTTPSPSPMTKVPLPSSPPSSG